MTRLAVPGSRHCSRTWRPNPLRARLHGCLRIRRRTRAERDALRDRAREVGAAVELRFLDVSLDVLWGRISNRNNKLPASTAAIDRADLVQWCQSLQRPDVDEMSSYDAAV